MLEICFNKNILKFIAISCLLCFFANIVNAEEKKPRKSNTKLVEKNSELVYKKKDAVLNESSIEKLNAKTDEEYFFDGMYYLADRSYGSSSEQFEALTRAYPSSPLAHDALIMEIFTKYLDNEKNQIEGIAEVFYRLFPNDPNEDYVLYMQGMAMYSTIKDPMIMLDRIVEAGKVFDDLVKRFPQSKYSAEAQKKIDYINLMRQANELKIADLYNDRFDYIAAMRRYTGLFEIYKDKLHPEIEEDALCKLVHLSKALNIDNESTKYQELLLKKYPNTKCFK